MELCCWCGMSFSLRCFRDIHHWLKWLQAWLPDSPRWLMLAGKGKDAATKATKRLRGSFGSNAAVQTEVEGIIASTRSSSQQKSSELFKATPLLKRHGKGCGVLELEELVALQASRTCSRGAICSPSRSGCLSCSCSRSLASPVFCTML